MDSTTKELGLISVLGLMALGLVWRYEADWFAILFGVAAAIAMVEAVRLVSVVAAVNLDRPNPPNAASYCRAP